MIQVNNNSDKRKSRSEVILDYDDMLIFLCLSKGIHSITEIKKELKISHNGLTNHLRRLQNNNFIRIIRDPLEHRRKIITLSLIGHELYKTVLNRHLL